MRNILIAVIVFCLSIPGFSSEVKKPIYEKQWADGSYYKVFQISKCSGKRFALSGKTPIQGVQIEVEINNKDTGSEDSIYADTLELKTQNNFRMEAKYTTSSSIKLPGKDALVMVKPGEKVHGWIYYEVITDGENVGNFVSMRYGSDKSSKWVKIPIN